MLTFFRRIIRRDPPSSPPQAAAHCHCHESEFCFFNHAATFAFDQVTECEQNAPPRKEKSRE
ncbi:hypothetical protein BIY26_12985 [Brenneria goodwinii]|uniref:Uncharacterized protein n=1 Tax=Brenneria goodwinii TaxID=1109412 RepID=A0A0G4JZ98_9GAMM|nr:hypothetical protein AWC36_05640 [Brenneria goodwinii]RLM20536.1 hypothetical protein BIY28_13750 [Brenneria goodwinii]RLM22623.1 hypothetical protein BIY26_12985 [Brenneria goodwinii]CPR19411.1 hypothetical protein BN1221_03745c [Brenneria goodwinii]